MTQRVGQFTHLVSAFHFNALHQIAAGDMADVVDETGQRRDQRLLDTQPHAHDDHQHNDQHADQHPDRLAVRAVAVFHRHLIQLVVLQQVVHILLLKTILIALGRLIEESVNFACPQQLNQLRQRAVINIVVTLNFHRFSVALTRIARQGFVGSPVFFRLFQ